MSRQRVRFVTEWVSQGGLRRAYAPSGFAGTIRDVTGQSPEAIPPTPNLVVVEAWGEPAAIETLAGDPKCIELWREEMSDGLG